MRDLDSEAVIASCATVIALKLSGVLTMGWDFVGIYCAVWYLLTIIKERLNEHRT